MFRPLSLAAKERLATKLVPLEVHEGATIVRAGDVGDRFYLVDSGTVRIGLEEGEKESGAGDYFGEIALLDGGPRSASVIAETPLQTMTVNRKPFHSMLQREPTIVLKMLEEVAGRLRNAERSLTG